MPFELTVHVGRFNAATGLHEGAEGTIVRAYPANFPEATFRDGIEELQYLEVLATVDENGEAVLSFTRPDEGLDPANREYVVVYPNGWKICGEIPNVAAATVKEAFDDHGWGPCAAIPSNPIYGYSRIKNDDAALTQRKTLHFSKWFRVTDDSANGETDVAPATQYVTEDLDGSAADILIEWDEAVALDDQIITPRLYIDDNQGLASYAVVNDTRTTTSCVVRLAVPVVGRLVVTIEEAP